MSQQSTLSDGEADSLLAQLRAGADLSPATARAFADWIADMWQRCDLAERREDTLRSQLADARRQLALTLLAAMRLPVTPGLPDASRQALDLLRRDGLL